MSLGEIGLELKCLAARDVGLSKIEFPCVEIGVEKQVTIGDARMCASVLGIDIDRLVEHLPGVIDALSSELMEVLPATQVEVIRLNVHRACLLYLLLLALG